MDLTTMPVGIVGAGPVGLAAAAHLHERKIPFVLFEAGDDVAANVSEWAHVQLFSPWRFNIDPAARRLLEANGWTAPDPDEHPTGGDLIDRYLAPLGLLPEIARHLRTNRLVISVTRSGFDKVRTSGRDEAPFVVTTDGPHRPRTNPRLGGDRRLRDLGQPEPARCRRRPRAWRAKGPGPHRHRHPRRARS